MRLAAAFVLLPLFAVPAHAGATGWTELGPGTRVRLITSDMLNADGTTLAAIELDMPVGTRTYWRVPGETGIPTELDTTGSTGIAGHRFIWPYPLIEENGGYTDFVYNGSVVIPLELKVDGDSAELKASLLLGVCSDICIPASAEFNLPLSFAKSDPAQDIRIVQALATVPIAWDGPPAAVGDPLFDAETEVLSVPVDAAQIDPSSLIGDVSASGHLLGAPQKSPEPGIVDLPLLGADEGADLVGKPVQLIFMTQNGPYEVSRTVKASTPGSS
jgi:DsbC/DsbD-like thiol-disulfide interchange protein